MQYRGRDVRHYVCSMLCQLDRAMYEMRPVKNSLRGPSTDDIENARTHMGSVGFAYGHLSKISKLQKPLVAKSTGEAKFCSVACHYRIDVQGLLRYESYSKLLNSVFCSLNIWDRRRAWNIADFLGSKVKNNARRGSHLISADTTPSIPRWDHTQERWRFTDDVGLNHLHPRFPDWIQIKSSFTVHHGWQSYRNIFLILSLTGWRKSFVLPGLNWIESLDPMTQHQLDCALRGCETSEIHSGERHMFPWNLGFYSIRVTHKTYWEISSSIR